MSDERRVLRHQVVALRRTGLSYRKIAKETGTSKIFVDKWCKRFDQEQSVADHRRSGRPRAVTPSVAKSIVTLLKQTPSVRVTQRALQQQGVTLSVSTIHSHASELMEVKSVRKKPLLTEKQMEDRLDFAKTNLRRSLSFWRSMLFTDEKCYETFRAPHHVWVARGAPAPVLPSVKRPPKIQLWGGISYYGKTSLVRLQGRQTSATYIERLEENLPNKERNIFPGRWTFMHDSTGYGVHGSKATRKWLDAHVLWLDPWPANSPDLNPIEHVWAMLTRDVESQNPKSVDQYWSALQLAWSELDRDTIRGLVYSMPRRLRAVIDAGGGNTKY